MKIRLTTQEVAELKAAAQTANMSMADFVMMAARERPTIVIDGVPDLIRELRKEETNLNQAMRLANEVGDTKLIPQLREAIQKNRTAQSEVIRFIERHEIRLAEKRGEQNGDHDQQT